MSNLNQTERLVLSQMLDRLGDYMSIAGCNDLELPDTPEGRALAQEAENLDNDDPRVPASLITYDWKVLHILRRKIGLPEGGTSND